MASKLLASMHNPPGPGDSDDEYAEAEAGSVEAAREAIAEAMESGDGEAMADAVEALIYACKGGGVSIEIG